MSPAERLPYPGLRPFRRDESDLFFGRETCVDAMVAQLTATRFLAVLGSSGSGKSSLVRTGLLDALELGLMAGAGPSWLIADLYPGFRPIENLARALLALPATIGDTEPDPHDVAAFVRMLRRGPRSLVAWWQGRHLPERANLLLLVDQFEELFRYVDPASNDEAEAFVALLIHSAAAADLSIHVVLTMRSEFLGPCALIPDLAEWINKGLYLTRRMTREEMRGAIEGPAGVCGFTIEPRLVNHLLNDLASFAPWEGERGADQFQLLARRADQLPLLQHVLNRLWLATRGSDNPDPITLRLDAYEAIGGMAGALDGHAEEVLAGIAPEYQPFAEPIFRALVGGTSIATAVRRPCRVAELITLVHGSRAAVAAVVDAFCDPGCNFLVAAPAGPLEPETTIDIGHESLIRQWQRLSGWLVAEAGAAEEYRYLEETARRWQAGGAGLLTMPTLANTLAWQALERPNEAWATRYGGDFRLAMRFLEESDRHRRRRRWMKIGAIAVGPLLLVLGMGVGLVIQGHQLHRFHAAANWDELGINQLTDQGPIGLANSKLALRSFHKAVELGSSDAEYRLGMLYLHSGMILPCGHGVNEYRKAMKWFRKAAQEGNIYAEGWIGYMYLHGLGVSKKNYTQAMVWYRKADASGAYGNGIAEAQIGWMYEKGLGVPENKQTALHWYRRAAKQDNRNGENEIGWFREHGIVVSKDLGRAMIWYKRAAHQGLPYAERQIGGLYKNGLGVPRSYTEAMRWYQKAALQGDRGAEYQIGWLYEKGLDGPPSPTEARHWYRKAALQGDRRAEYQIGLLYQHGLGVPKDPGKARAWISRAAKAGYKDAEAWLARHPGPPGEITTSGSSMCHAGSLSGPGVASGGSPEGG